MFNLSTTGNVAYNGISQLSENQCSFSDPTESTSRTKLRAYMNSDGENKFNVGSRAPSDGNHISVVSKLRLTNPKEDVYAFNDCDQPFVDGKISDPHLRGSLTYSKTEGLFSKKTIAGGLITSPKKVQIVKPPNGYACNNGSDDLRNGIYKAPTAHENPVRSFNSKSSSPHRITVKQNKDLFAPLPYSKDVKSESDVISSKLHGLNNFTKNSITNSNFKPVFVKSNTLYQNKKPADVLVKQESGKFGIGTDGYTSPYSNYLNKNNSKIVAKKLPSGKPPPRFNKVRRGRGPALHESLQRITPSPAVKLFNPIAAIANEDCWHSPGTDIFDCGVIDSYQSNNAYNDSDPSDDDTFDHVDSWLLESDSDADKKEKSTVTRASLRRRITQLKQLEVISSSSKTSSALYNAIKMQMKQHRKNNYNDGYRVHGTALNILHAANGTNSFLSSEDKRNIKQRGRMIESPVCAYAGCVAPPLDHTQHCLAHISNSPEQKLFSECIPKYSNNTQCRVPSVDVINEIPICTEQTWNKNNYVKIAQNVNAKHSRKRSKPHAEIITPPKNHIELQSTTIVNDISNVVENTHFDRFANDPHFFTPEDIGQTVGAVLFNHNDTTTELNVCSNSSTYESSEDTGIGGLSDSELIASVNHPPHIDPDVVAEVFAMHETEDLPLDLPAPGPAHEPNIDLTTVFNDFFAEQNGEYIPSREETEELERALEAVNKDVKSLEKLTGTQHSSLLLDTLLDERVFAETLASLPDVFSNIPAAKISSGNAIDATPSLS